MKKSIILHKTALKKLTGAMMSLEPVIELLKKNLDTETLVPEALHNCMKQLSVQYVVVGGMPELFPDATIFQLRCFLWTEIRKVSKRFFGILKSTM